MYLFRRAPHVLGAALLCCLMAAPAPAQQLDTTKLAAMQARAIGPAGMSGRVTAIDVVRHDPDVIYAGTASGGLWKSETGGVTWMPIFDDQPVASIGAVAIDPTNPDVVWVGTGEGNPRNSQTSGNGVYKSLDAGRTWMHLGLDASRNVHRVLINPQNPDVVYVGAQGPAWGETDERGVFKTTDGGETWEKILYINEKTGIADLVMDPQNPNKLIAAMWEFRRWPWFFESGGAGSGLYVTHDGGQTWTERTDDDGLPAGELGRIGLAIAPSRPNVVYAFVEAEKENALYRSTDGGATWKKTKSAGPVGNRPFYYADIYVDPTNENRIYSLHSIVTKSEDGGETFEPFIGWEVHPDHHAWYMHPDDPDYIIDGNDGGLYISRDRGHSWRFAENLPLAQFYHVSADMAVPYNVYGGLQDNGSWKGPSQVWRQGGIRNAYWEEVAFGDGFDVVVDESDPRYLYAMSQGGNLLRSDLESGEQQFIKPIVAGETTLRFNWNAGIAHDPFSPTTIYYGSQHLHRSDDRGETWTTISPDLTTNDPEKQRQLDSGGLTYDVTNAENFTTIIAVAPSPVQQGVIWVGTDDGQVQLTTDGGASWTNLADRFRGVPEGTWVPQIRASRHGAGEAFVVFDNHRHNDWTPYVYHTTDFGETWRRIADDDKVWGYALAIDQDPVARDLLFLGTEFGLYVSIDGGDTWTQWTHGFPTVSAMDLLVHPRAHDLVVGTFGRSIYILDDIRPLRALAQEGVELLDEPLHVFDAPDAYLAEYKQAAGTRFSAHAMFEGENRPYGALISYVLNPDAADVPDDDEEGEDEGDDEVMEGETEAEAEEAADGPPGGGRKKVKVEILDASGTVIRALQRDAEPGLNRFAWELDRKGVRYPMQPKPKADAPEPGGPSVLPGTYTVRLTYGDHTDETTVEVMMDPRIDVSAEALQAQQALDARFNAHVTLATEAADRLRASQKTVRAIDERLAERDDDAAKEAKRLGKAMQDSIKTLLIAFNGDSEAKGIRRDPNTVVAKLFTARRYLHSAWGAHGAPIEIALGHAASTLADALADVNAFYADDWPGYRAAVEAAEVSFFEAYEPLRLGTD